MSRQPGRGQSAGLLCLIGLLVLSCRYSVPEDGGDIPVSFLQDRLREVVADLEQARGGLPESAAEASGRLEDARLELRRLDEYYLPLLAARQQVGRAARSVTSDEGTARSAVDSAETVLRGIVRAHGRHLEREMRGPLERLQDSRTALEAGDVGEARRILDSLHHQLRLMFFRGDLVLQGSELDPEGGSNRE